MVAVKVQCGCGQRYAFDIESSGSLQPGTVTCPACSADGTSAANEALAQQLIVTAAPISNAIRVAGPLPAVNPSPARVAQVAPTDAPALTTQGTLPAGGKLAGFLDRNRAIAEARSKIMWGEEKKTVAAFLRVHGFSPEDASSTVEEISNERTATVRGEGIRKTVIGSGLILVPIVAFFVFMSAGRIPIKLFAVTLALGCYGLYLAVTGAIMFLAPRTQGGDVADH